MKAVVPCDLGSIANAPPQSADKRRDIDGEARAAPRRVFAFDEKG